MDETDCQELSSNKQELWQLIRKSSAREMDFKAMEKEINEGKRICIGVIGSDLDESLPLRKVFLRL
jgi:late competence protein required for DNA uptake (superfamily II DNA/RNA helicase)